MGIFNKLTGYRLQQAGTLETAHSAGKHAPEDRICNLKAVSALEAVSTAVLLLDAEQTVQYVNPAATSLLEQLQEDIRLLSPGFLASQVEGTRLDFIKGLTRAVEPQFDILASMDNKAGHDILTVGDKSLEYSVKPVLDNHSRVGTLIELNDITWLLAQQRSRAAAQARQDELARELGQLQQVLDSMSNGVLVTDTDQRITYANAGVIRLLKEVENEIRAYTPEFSAEHMPGCSMAVFPWHAEVAAHMTASHDRNKCDRVQLGERTFRLLMNPVQDKAGKLLGTTVELRDLTLVIQMENTALHAIESAAMGDLGKRIAVENLSDNMLQVFRAINNMLDTLEPVIMQTSATMQAMANGEISSKINAGYPGVFGKLATDINITMSRLEAVVGEIRDTAAQVKSGARDITDGNSNLNARTEQQAASLEETSAAMEQITSTVQQNAANAVQANLLAQGARESAESGGVVVGKAIAAMDGISASSARINDIIGVIDEIAFQTNLLALNAAVEAARAGDQGRGFAVVAEEVRNLAGRSARAAKEIKTLIRDSNEKVQEGSLLVNRSGETLADIVAAVKKVNDIVAEISTASDEQAIGLNEINRAVAEMDDMTQQNAALVEQSAAASQSLESNAETLDALLRFFNGSSQSVSQASDTPVFQGAGTGTTRKQASLHKRESARPPVVVARRKPGPSIRNALNNDWSEF